MSEKRIIEIQGVKLEVDLSKAVRLDEFKIGDNVKVLQKTYSEKYEIHPGVIVEFINFTKLPSIVIAVVKNDYGQVKLEFVNYNQDTEGIEIAPSSGHDLNLEKNRVIDFFDRDIEVKKNELSNLLGKRDYFLQHFNKYFEVEGENA